MEANKLAVLDKGYVRLVDSMGSDLTVVNAARVSYDKQVDELGPKDERLIRFLAREGHTSPFRHATMQFEVYAPLMIARQWFKYLVGSHITQDAWNESCLPIDETVTMFDGTKKTISELLERHNSDKKTTVRSVNENGEIVPGEVVNVWKTGTRDVYEVESELGYKVRTTDNHRYMTPSGYVELKDLAVGDEVMMNGVPAYRDSEWLKDQYVTQAKSQKEIAEIAGCSVHTIRKWVREFGLQQDQVSRMLAHNKEHGVFGKGLTNETSEVIRQRSEKMAASKKGVPCPREFGKPSKDNTGHWQARKLFEKDICTYCDETDSAKLELHHIDGNPKNNEPENVECVCVKHHQMRHGKTVLMVAHPVKIASIRKVSHEDVYDIEVAEYHNFVSNQFVVHNSRRYVTENEEFYVPQSDEWRSKPANSKQGSGPNLDAAHGGVWTDQLLHHYDNCVSQYEQAMDAGIAPEQARLFLPANGMYVRFYWTASLQSVAHLINQRIASDAQFEFQQYAQAVKHLATERFPVALETLLN